MGFDFNAMLAQSCVVLIILVMITSINLGELNDLISGIKLQIPNMAKLAANFLILTFILSIFLIPSLKANIAKIINRPFEYSIKLLDKFMK
jgi:hypothetical protein